MIIMHHHICPVNLVPIDSNVVKAEGWKFNFSPDALERQILFFKNKGYQFVSIHQYYKDLTKKGREHPKEVVMTFDDGWKDNFLYAFPLLKKHNIPALFFVSTHQLTDGTSEKMNKAEMVEMQRDGMSFGSHTCNHFDLTKLPEAGAIFEISESKKILEELFASPILFFAYPGGAFNSKIVNITMDAGYLGAFSVLSPAINTIDDRFWLFRNVFSEFQSTMADKYRLTGWLVKALEIRVRRKLQNKLKFPNG